MKTASVLLFAPLSFFLFSCAATVSKHGPVKTEERRIEAYTRLDISGAVEVDFTAGDKPSATVEAPDDIIPKIETEVRNGTLRISMHGELNCIKDPIRVHLTGSSLEAADISGASSLGLQSPLNGDAFRLSMTGASSFRGTVYLKTLNVDLSGASVAEIGGMTNTFNAETSGASTLKGDKLAAVKAVVKSGGASSTTLRADSSLSAKASGASSISYSGNPPVLEKETSGASDITKGKQE